MKHKNQILEIITNPILRESIFDHNLLDILASKICSSNLEPSKIYLNSTSLVTDERKSKSLFLTTDDLPDGFVKIFFNCLKNNWEIDEKNFSVETAQYARYEKGDYFKWHHDQIPPKTEEQIRVFTCVLMMSHPENYSGGEFQYIDYFGEQKSISNFVRGDFIIFPSRLKHQVSNVEGGIRETLTLWLRSDPIQT